MSMESALTVASDAYIPHTDARVRPRTLILGAGIVILIAFGAATRTWPPLVFLVLPAAVLLAVYRRRVARFRAARALILRAGTAVVATVVNRRVDTKVGYHLVKVRFELEGRCQMREAHVADKVAIRCREGATVSVLVHPQVAEGFVPASLAVSTPTAPAQNAPLP